MIKINTEKIDKKQTIYLSGPMSGLPDYNRAAFNLRAEALRAAGYTVNNPAEISVTHGTSKPYGFYFKRAMQQLLQSDVVYVFGDITQSKGAQTEINVAKMAEMPVIWEVCAGVR